MNPEEESLQQSQHHISHSAAWVLVRLVGGVLLVETAYAVFIALALTPLFASFQTETTIGLWIVHSIKSLLIIAITIAIVAPWAGVHYYITDQQLIRYSGFSRRDEVTYDLDSLTQVELHQGWFGRLFNYGDVQLHFSSAGTHTSLEMQGIYNPKKYERVLRSYLHTDEAAKG